MRGAGLEEHSGRQNLLSLRPFNGHGAAFVAFTRDGKTLVSGGGDGFGCVWDLEYFERHISGNLQQQIELHRFTMGDSIRTDHLMSWAAAVMARPEPRCGAHAACVEPIGSTPENSLGVGPATIALWGTGGLVGP